MNERIRELAHQARQIGEYGNYGQIQLSPAQFEQKFAELIVRECVGICTENGSSYQYSFTPARARLAEATSNHCGQLIKKHFGVE
jgi:hypothetical protein